MTGITRVHTIYKVVNWGGEGTKVWQSHRKIHLNV